MEMKNKGEMGDMSFILVLFILLGIIGVSVIFGLSVIFGNDYDHRVGEANDLNLKINKCIENKGIEKLIVGDSFMFEECGLRGEIIKDLSESNQIRILICKDRCVSGSSEGVIFQLGSDFVSCDLSDKNENFVKCSDSFVESGEKSYQIKVGSDHWSVKS